VVFLRCAVPAEHPSCETLGEERLGTGVAIERRSVLTAHYLVIGAEQIEVVDSSGRTHAVRKVHVDHETGLALLTTDGADLHATTLGTGDEAVPGAPVFLIASTDERGRKGATGLITRVGPFEAYWEYMLDQAILTTCANPGLAGAPLFDLGGRVIGLVTLGLLAVGRSSVAVPISLYWRYREELEGVVPARPARAWLGLYLQTVGDGTVVAGVVSDGPADQAGLQQGDLVLSVNDEDVSSLRSAYVSIQKHRPRERLRLRVMRASTILSVGVVAASRAEFYA
jgi:S1-C subfamily serine protease